jgi:hypothetical protein
VEVAGVHPSEPNAHGQEDGRPDEHEWEDPPAAVIAVFSQEVVVIPVVDHERHGVADLVPSNLRRPDQDALAAAHIEGQQVLAVLSRGRRIQDGGDPDLAMAARVTLSVSRTPSQMSIPRPAPPMTRAQNHRAISHIHRYRISDSSWSALA